MTTTQGKTKKLINSGVSASHGFALNPEAMIDFKPWRNSHSGLNFPCWSNTSTAAFLPKDKSFFGHARLLLGAVWSCSVCICQNCPKKGGTRVFNNCFTNRHTAMGENSQTKLKKARSRGKNIVGCVWAISPLQLFG